MGIRDPTLVGILGFRCGAAPNVCSVRLHLLNGEPGAGGPGHGDLS